MGWVFLAIATLLYAPVQADVQVTARPAVTFRLTLRFAGLSWVFDGDIARGDAGYKLSLLRLGGKKRHAFSLRGAIHDVDATFHSVLPPVLRVVRQRLAVHMLTGTAHIGLSDAAATAVCYGAVCAAVRALCVRLRAVAGARPQVRILPDFKRRRFYARVRCIIALRVGDIMRVGIMLLAHAAHAAWRARIKARAQAAAAYHRS